MMKKAIRIIGLLIVAITIFHTICLADEIDPGFDLKTDKEPNYYYNGTQTGTLVQSSKPNLAYVIVIGFVVLLVICISYYILKYMKNNSNFEVEYKNNENSNEEEK